MCDDFGRHFIYAGLAAWPVWQFWRAAETHAIRSGRRLIEAALDTELFTTRLVLELFLLVAIACAWLPEIVADLRKADILAWYR